jgi:hypothetical protein
MITIKRIIIYLLSFFLIVLIVSDLVIISQLAWEILGLDFYEAVFGEGFMAWKIVEIIIIIGLMIFVYFQKNIVDHEPFIGIGIILILLIAITLQFIWMLGSFYSAIFLSGIFALFNPATWFQ